MPDSLRRALVQWGLSLLLVAPIAACNTSPKPEPPITLPGPPSLDGSLVYYEIADGGVHAAVVGQPLAVTPVLGSVRAWNLETSDPAALSPVADDGSFTLVLDAKAGDELRIEALGPEAASGPQDFVLGKPNSALASPLRPLGDCLELIYGALVWIEPGATSQLRVQNGCAFDVTLSAPRPRSDLDRLEVGQDVTWPAVLVVGGSVDFAVRILDGNVGDELLFFLEATAPKYDRRAISVRLGE